MFLTLLVLLIVTTLGSGMMAGLFASFSYFMMRAFAAMSPAEGMRAMQSVNVAIVRPLFLLVFMGTAVAGIALLVVGWRTLKPETYQWAAAGVGLYILTSIVITILCNIPLNNRLAAADADTDEGRAVWDGYLRTWTRWNHVRTLGTMTSTIFLCLALLLW